MVNKILDFIYPPKCIVCDSIIPLENERWVCFNCKDFFNYIEGNTCIVCGIKLEKDVKKCISCLERKHLFIKNTPIFVYEDIIQDVIYKFKYGKKPHLGKGLGAIMSKRLLATPEMYKDINYVVPIPIHKNRMKKRGFNQAELLSKEISKTIGVPMVKNLIIRIKDTKPQSSFSPKERKNNLKNAFIVNKKYDLNFKNILLVDDIYTTGSTLNACCEVLQSAGAKEIYATTFSIILKSN